MKPEEKKSRKKQRKVTEEGLELHVDDNQEDQSTADDDEVVKSVTRQIESRQMKTQKA